MPKINAPEVNWTEIDPVTAAHNRRRAIAMMRTKVRRPSLAARIYAWLNAPAW